MKLTNKQLKQIIKEEISKTFNENEGFDAEEALYAALVLADESSELGGYVDEDEWYKREDSRALSDLVSGFTDSEDVDWYARLIISLFLGTSSAQVLPGLLKPLEQSQQKLLLTARDDLYDDYNLDYWLHGKGEEY